jgi:hypothetical protein
VDNPNNPNNPNNLHHRAAPRLERLRHHNLAVSGQKRRDVLKGAHWIRHYHQRAAKVCAGQSFASSVHEVVYIVVNGRMSDLADIGQLFADETFTTGLDVVWLIVNSNEPDLLATQKIFIIYQRGTCSDSNVEDHGICSTKVICMSAGIIQPTNWEKIEDFRIPVRLVEHHKANENVQTRWNGPNHLVVIFTMKMS